MPPTLLSIFEGWWGDSPQKSKIRAVQHNSLQNTIPDKFWKVPPTLLSIFERWRGFTPKIINSFITAQLLTKNRPYDCEMLLKQKKTTANGNKWNRSPRLQDLYTLGRWGPYVAEGVVPCGFQNANLRFKICKMVQFALKSMQNVAICHKINAKCCNLH